MRATLSLGRIKAGEEDAVRRLVPHMGTSMSRRSDNIGRGCCVHIWDVKELAEAVAELPVEVRSKRDWTRAPAS